MVTSDSTESPIPMNFAEEHSEDHDFNWECKQDSVPGSFGEFELSPKYEYPLNYEEDRKDVDALINTVVVPILGLGKKKSWRGLLITDVLVQLADEVQLRKYCYETNSESNPTCPKHTTGDFFIFRYFVRLFK